ncbi:MAG: ABC transporter substrate-binding protein [Mycobacteriales bacterium]
MRRGRVIVVLIALLGIVAACGGTSKSKGSSGPDLSKGEKGPITVANAGFTESEVVSYLYADVLNKIGYKVNVQKVSASEVFQKSLESGDVTVVPEYAATYADQLNKIVHGPKAPSVASPDLAATMAKLTPLAKKRKLTVLEPSKAVDQNAFAVAKKFADANKLKTLTDLGKLGKPLKLAAGPECATRPFCVPGLKKTYGITITKVDPLGVDTAASKSAVKDGTDDLALVLTTDATVGDSGLVVLTDDKKLQNADYLVPVANTAKLTPAMTTALNKLSAVMTTDDLAQMNKKVDAGQQKAPDVAAAYLKDKGLL